jgi:hypothetical protein
VVAGGEKTRPGELAPSPATTASPPEPTRHPRNPTQVQRRRTQPAVGYRVLLAGFVGLALVLLWSNRLV